MLYSSKIWENCTIEAANENFLGFILIFLRIIEKYFFPILSINTGFGWRIRVWMTYTGMDTDTGTDMGTGTGMGTGMGTGTVMGTGTGMGTGTDPGSAYGYEHGCYTSSGE